MLDFTGLPLVAEDELEVASFESEAEATYTCEQLRDLDGIPIHAIRWGVDHKDCDQTRKKTRYHRSYEKGGADGKIPGGA